MRAALAAQAATPALDHALSRSPLVLRRCTCGGTPGPDGECTACKAKRLQGSVAGAGSSGAGPAVAPPIVHDVLRSPGHPLEPSVRGEMEGRFGHDFSSVRLHTDGHAAESARAVRASAYTVGENIAFGAGRYAPETPAGARLLAHELAHVRQQAGNASPPAVMPRLAVAENGSPLEREADAAANAVVGATGVVPVAMSLRASAIDLARKPADDDERAKAIAEAEAAAARLDQQLADADNDDEPDTKSTTRPTKAPSRFSPGGFTDKEADALLQEAQGRVKLGSMALTLAERQARRREFWDGNPSYNSADVKEAFDLDLYWDPEQEGFIRQPYVAKAEAVVLADPEAGRLYSDRLWDLTENKPAKKSRFDRAMGFVCAHTEPCSSNLEQFRLCLESGKSRDDCLNRGMARLVVAAETMALPGPGPSGPIQVGPGRPTGMPFEVPATEGAKLGGADTPAAPTSEPLLTTGSKPGKPPQGEIAPPVKEAVPEPITDEAPTNPIPKGTEVGEPTEGGERIGDFRIYGEKGLKGNTFEREILGWQGPPKPMRTAARGVGPLLRLFKVLIAEARGTGATQLRVIGRAVGNDNILEMKPIVEKYGGTFRQVDETTVEIEIPLSKQRGE